MVIALLTVFTPLSSLLGYVKKNNDLKLLSEDNPAYDCSGIELHQTISMLINQSLSYPVKISLKRVLFTFPLSELYYKLKGEGVHIFYIFES